MEHWSNFQCIREDCFNEFNSKLVVQLCPSCGGNKIMQMNVDESEEEEQESDFEIDDVDEAEEEEQESYFVFSNKHCIYYYIS